MCAPFLFWESQCGGELGQLANERTDVIIRTVCRRSRIDVEWSSNLLS